LIAENNLKILAENRYKDCLRLLFCGRYQGCIYIGGYVVELLLKNNVCRLYRLFNGYPETKVDYTLYSSSIKNFINIFPDINKLKTHDLTLLLYYSGKELKIKTQAIREWDNITNIVKWKPEIRYVNKIYYLKNAIGFIKSIKKIRKILMN
jgi:hypothetical protein